MSISIGDISSVMNQGSSKRTDAKADALTGALGNISENPTEEELKGVLKDFESYFVEQILKKMKETFTEEDEEGDSVMSQYKDIHMDAAYQMVAEQLVDDIGENYTQQLYEQMKRNYNLD